MNDDILDIVITLLICVFAVAIFLLPMLGVTYNPRVETLKQIADALGVGIDDLMK